MAKAIWNGKVVAESDRFEEVEGNIYFPPETLKREYFTESDHTSICPWKVGMISQRGYRCGRS